MFPETSKNEIISQSEIATNKNGFPFDSNVMNTSICNTLQNTTPNSIIICIFPHSSSSIPPSSSSSLSSPSSSPSSSFPSFSPSSNASHSSVTSYALIPLSSTSSFPPTTSPSVVSPSSSFSSSLPPFSFSSSYHLPSSFSSFPTNLPFFASSPSAPLSLSSASPTGVFSANSVSSSHSNPLGVPFTSLPNRASPNPNNVFPSQWSALSKQRQPLHMCMPASEFVNPAEYLRKLCKNLECLGFRPPFPSREHFCCSRCKYRKGNVCKANAETSLRMSKVRIRREFETWVREGKRKPSEVEARRREMSAMIDTDCR